MTLIEELEASIAQRAEYESECILRHLQSKVLGLADGAVGLMPGDLRDQAKAHASALAELLRPTVERNTVASLRDRAIVNLLKQEAQ